STDFNGTRRCIEPSSWPGRRNLSQFEGRAAVGASRGGESCSILTTTPNALLADIHDRMPTILRPDDYDLWLNPTAQNTESALRLLAPYTGRMRRYAVSTRVNQ